MSIKDIEEDWAVFSHDGDVSIGAVRRIRPKGIVAYIENFDDVTFEEKDIARAGEGKVVLQPDCLSREVLDAITHAHDKESGRTSR
ncbi:hypothetical protein [Qipengyuania qiaonensis]|uniref:DUF2171 domain-containing protein n=1 Tax=Qipengyuania qiaonensis TaxID=2867240 RepID=A0ABS7J9V5_9SPHN|nr:hypothetical protein [Qipengyuania qiaonensis]MBX7484097.1 hypothetical protein [Qipengyuania qiaonensis]